MILAMERIETLEEDLREKEVQEAESIFTVNYSIKVK